MHERHAGPLDARAATSSRSPTAAGSIRARQVVLATNAYPPLAAAAAPARMPIYDHVLVTEPLPDGARQHRLGRAQGLTDVGNQFHYYRRTADDRILWGGYDAIYYFGNRTDAAREQRDASHRLLAEQFFATFPQLEGVRFTHRWAGPDRLDVALHALFGPPLRGRSRTPSDSPASACGLAASGPGRARPARRAGHRADGAVLSEAAGAVPAGAAALPGRAGDPAALARRTRPGGAAPCLRTLDRFGVGFNC